MQSLTALQSTLQRVYQIDLGLDVARFVTTDQRWLATGADAGGSSAEETVYVSQDGEDLYISVFLDAALLQRVESACQSNSAGVGLHDICLVVEGVSHFMLLATRALQSRQATAFEMELQAEIDKFLVLTDLASNGGDGFMETHRRLFSAVTLRPEMSAPLAQRYIDASRFASRYCQQLRHLRSRPEPGCRGLSEELYRFYRLSLPEKISHIERSSATCS
jgi:hypothetical protein